MSFADPALALPRADVVHYLWQQIRGFGRDVKVREYDGATGDPETVLAVTYIQVDTPAASRPRAWEIADQTRRTLRGLVDGPWPDAVITEMTVVSGPRWLPDENGQPCFVTRYRVGHHSRQGWTGPPVVTDFAAAVTDLAGTAATATIDIGVRPAHPGRP